MAPLFLPVLVLLQTQSTPATQASQPMSLQAAEAALPAAISRARLERHHRILTEDPHVAGTDADKRTAEYVRARLVEAGFEVEMPEYEVLLPYPEKIEITLVAPKEVKLALKEEGFEWDKDSFDGDVILPYSAFSASGTVTAPVLYANYGREEDFAWLQGQGLDCRGKIVMARHGKVFRGTKVKLAEQRGAVAVLLYSDPADDGYQHGDVYPRGPMRSESLVERGSILDLSTYPGDPLTPGQPALRDAVRMRREAAENLPKILCHPLSYKDATPILQALSGPSVPEGWQGGLPFAYHVGPGPARVKMSLQIQEKTRPIWNVIGTLGPADARLQFVVGNHRDAWVHGAIDPNSGTSALLEAAAAVGAAAKAGLRLRHRLVVASWDGEEFGLMGSTEWVEHHVKRLQEQCIAYLNSDPGIGGPRFHAAGSPALHQFLKDCAASVPHPRGGGSLFEVWRGKEPDARVEELGGGSDYLPFLVFAGIPSADCGFGGRTGVYHSAADDHWFMKTHVDPDFSLHAAHARYLATAMLRMGTAERLPLRQSALALHLRTRIEETVGLAPDLRQELMSALGKFEELARDADQRLVAGGEVDAALLLQVERAFLDQDGLPDRPFFRHLVHACSPTNGYGQDPLPALRRACRKQDAAGIRHELGRLTAAVTRATAALGKALKR